MKIVLKLNNNIILLFFCFLLCTSFTYGQKSTIHLKFSINFLDLNSFDAKQAFIQGDGSGNEIKVYVFDELKYKLNDGVSSESFLYGMRSGNADTKETNLSLGTFTRFGWDPFSLNDYIPIGEKYATNDPTIIKAKLINNMKGDKGKHFNSMKDEYSNIVVRIEVNGNNSLNRVKNVKLIGLKSFTPNIDVSSQINVVRGNTVVQTLNLSTLNSSNYRLEVLQGDELRFVAPISSNPIVRNLTETSIMRWAGESLFMQTTANMGDIKPFLMFDSNVHGIKVRNYPEEWMTNVKNRSFPSFENIGNNKVQLTWIANGRYNYSDRITTNTSYNVNALLKNHKFRDNNQSFPNRNKFYGKNTTTALNFQRNNQKEGLNMEILKAFKNKENLVAGLDPDELIYKDFNQSKFYGNNPTGKKLYYVENDQWKLMSLDETASLNNPLYIFLTETGKFISGQEKYSYNGFEIGDYNLFVRKTNSINIDGKTFNYADAQPMFNNKVPVYYNDVTTNKPIINAKQLEFAVGQNLFTIELRVTSPLEAERYGLAPDKILGTNNTEAVNFYGIIEGPKHVARFKKGVTYSVYKLPTKPYTGTFSLVYTNEDTNGFINQKRKVVTANDNKFTFDFGGGGYHEITLRYKSNASADNSKEVIIAGKELMDIDLRFIFSPNSEDAEDFSFNPSGVFPDNAGAAINKTVRLGENKANGKSWFLDNNNKLLSTTYGINHGYRDHSVVKTYTLDSDQTIVLTVLDADPHTFVHYNTDFYLSERRLSKRLQDADLANKDGKTAIAWKVSKSSDFANSKIIGYGRHQKITPKDIYPTGIFTKPYTGPIYVKAVFDDANEIKVKIVTINAANTVSAIVDGSTSTKSLGTVSLYNLSIDQLNFIKKLRPGSFTKPIERYKIFKIKDILSSYTYGKSPLNNGKLAPRFKQNGMQEVGEHKRFSDENNYDSRFNWDFKIKNISYKNPTDINDVFDNKFDTDDVNKLYVANYESKWFPKNWVRHLDSEPRSPEVPPNPNDSVELFNNSQNTKLSDFNNGIEPYEPWQIRLPWIAQSGLNGYKVRWNIKCIYDVNKLFDKQRLVNSIADTSQEYSQNIIGGGGLKIIPNYSDDNREYQEFYSMLRNKEIVIVDYELLQQYLKSNAKNWDLLLVVRDQLTTVYNSLISNAVLTTGAKSTDFSLSPDDVDGGKPTFEAKQELATNDSNLFNVSPNPSSTGIFTLTINVPKENSRIELMLKNVDGKIIYTSNPVTISNTYSTTLGENLNLAKGIYFVSIKVNDYSETKKLIVN